MSAAILSLAAASSGSQASAAPPAVRAIWADRAPAIDGRIDDPAWQRAAERSGFVERYPRLGAKPPVSTTFRVLFDREALYFAVRCADDHPVRARSRARDSSTIWRDDAISIKLDPDHDHRTTLGFTLGPAGARLDYRGIDEAQFRIEFDAVWQGAARITSDGWTAEFRIPFVALGIDPLSPPAEIGLNVTRDHARRFATYDWALLPPPFSPISASRYGHLVGLPALREHARGARSLHLTLTPHLLGGFERAAAEGGDLATSPRFSGGVDARMTMAGGWRGQLTVNTDFAQVDLDDQVVNLTRFGLFFPEKRDFFLRDHELFSFGRPEEAQLLYTRRIGLARGVEIPIVGGVKIIGRASERAKVGLLQVTTRPRSEMPWSSNLVGRGLFELGSGSKAGLMLAHRQSLEQAADHNLVIGLDGSWRASAGRLLLEGFSLVSLTGAAAASPLQATGALGTVGGVDRPAPAAAATIAWRGLLIRPQLAYAFYHPDLRADLGFFRRVGVHDADAALVVEPRIERLGIERVQLSAFGGVVATVEGLSFLDGNAGGRVALFADSGLALAAEGEHIHETVVESFTVGRQTEIGAGIYAMNRFAIEASTPSTLPASLSIALSRRDYYEGTLTALGGTVSVRPTPLLRYDLGGEHRRAIFDDSQRNFASAVINGRVALGLTRDLGIDLFVAWNNIEDLLRLQGRLRWTFLVGSDLFVVYQHDLEDDTGVTRYHSLVAKATYSWP